MAIVKALKATDQRNRFGVTFRGLYYRVIDVSIHAGTDTAIVTVAGYANTSARKLEADTEKRRTEIEALFRNGVADPKKIPKEYDSWRDYREALREEAKSLPTIRPIVREELTINATALNATSVAETELKRAAYRYIKTLEQFQGGHDV